MGKKRRSRLAKWLLGCVVFWFAQLLLFRFVPVLITPHQLGQRLQGHTVTREWVPIEQISPHMVTAVISAEDNRFCAHWGIDWTAMKVVWREVQAGHRIRGGSTISMQTTKNAYLWLSRSKIRKFFEILMVPTVDRVWGKRRVMEVYLNVAEFGKGIYGVEAAAKHHFRTRASKLTRAQSSRLAAVLPAPKEWSASRPSRFIRRRARLIEHRMKDIDDRADCVLKDG